MRNAVYHIIRESRQQTHRERTGFLPLSALEGRGGRFDIVISDAAVGHTLDDIVVADPTRRDLVHGFGVRFYTRVSSFWIIIWFVGISLLASDNFFLM